MEEATVILSNHLSTDNKNEKNLLFSMRISFFSTRMLLGMFHFEHGKNKKRISILYLNPIMCICSYPDSTEMITGYSHFKERVSAFIC